MEKIIDQKLIGLIKERRSITFFDPSREIDNQTLKEIIELASTAPSSYNLQPWKIVIIKSKENKKILREICYNQEKVEHASANILILANTKAGIENSTKILENYMELGYIRPEQKESIRTSIVNSWSDPERAYKKALRDSSLFAMNLMICARIFGLETHPIEGYNEQELRKFLNLPNHLIPVMIICLGYQNPKERLLPRGYRFKFHEITYAII